MSEDPPTEPPTEPPTAPRVARKRRVPWRSLGLGIAVGIVIGLVGALHELYGAVLAGPALLLLAIEPAPGRWASWPSALIAGVALGVMTGVVCVSWVIDLLTTFAFMPLPIT